MKPYAVAPAPRVFAILLYGDQLVHEVGEPLPRTWKTRSAARRAFKNLPSWMKPGADIVRVRVRVAEQSDGPGAITYVVERARVSS